MSLSTPFICHLIAATLLTLALSFAGALSFGLLPVMSLPNVDLPIIVVSASLPGVSPETMASSVVTLLERSLGQTTRISEMTFSSSPSSTTMTFVFDPEKDIDNATHEVQAVISDATSLLPNDMPDNPSYREANPPGMLIMVPILTSETRNRGEIYDLASTMLAPKLLQVQGVGQMSVDGSSLPTVWVGLNPGTMSQYGLSLDSMYTAIAAANSNSPRGVVEKDDKHWQVGVNDRLRKAHEYESPVIHYNADNGAAMRLGDMAKASDSVEDVRNAGFSDDLPAVLLVVTHQPDANIIRATDTIHV